MLFCLVLMILAAIPLWAVEDNGNFNNNADPGASILNWTSGWPSAGMDGWNYVGQVNGASGTYLGNGWVVTAAHVGAGNFSLGGVTYTLVSGSTTSIDGGNVDLVLFQIASPPALPALVLGQVPPIPFSEQSGGDSVALIGYGGGGGETWGLNTVTAVNFTLSVLGRSTIDFCTSDGTTTIGSQSVTNNATVVTGDSGGGDFIFNASSGKWELAGINEAMGGASYFVQVSAYVQQILDITGLAAPPVITSEPQGMRLEAGSPLSLSTAANGSSPLTYQWFKNGAAISGATATTFSITSTLVSDSAAYSVKVTNGYGNATSSAANVTVVPMDISNLTTPQIGIIGQPVTYSIAVQGAGPITYQWLFNGTHISGATGNSYTIADTTSGSAGNYSVEASNTYGNVTSNASQLVIVVSQQVIQVGQSATFTATPSGTGPFTYQWQFNGNAIGLATGQSYTVSGAQQNQGGIYTVVITSPSGNVSSSFSLVVNIDVGDTPTMPAWGLAVLALLLLVAASGKRIRMESAPSDH